MVPLVPSRRVFLLGSKALNAPQFFPVLEPPAAISAPVVISIAKPLMYNYLAVLTTHVGLYQVTGFADRRSHFRTLYSPGLHAPVAPRTLHQSLAQVVEQEAPPAPKGVNIAPHCFESSLLRLPMIAGIALAWPFVDRCHSSRQNKVTFRP